MNRRQIKKRVKQAKLKKERGLMLSPEEQHFIRNYGKRYYTQTEVAFVIGNWDEITATVRSIVEGVSNVIADFCQGLADAFRRIGGAE